MIERRAPALAPALERVLPRAKECLQADIEDIDETVPGLDVLARPGPLLASETVEGGEDCAPADLPIAGDRDREAASISTVRTPSSR